MLCCTRERTRMVATTIAATPSDIEAEIAREAADCALESERMSSQRALRATSIAFTLSKTIKFRNEDSPSALSCHHDASAIRTERLAMTSAYPIAPW